MRNYLRDYYNQYMFSENEKDILNTPYISKFDNDPDYKQLEDEYFSRMPCCNISSNGRYITFDVSGTTIINKIFQKEVDNDTLIISTPYEHGSVQEELAHYDNVMLLNYENDICKCNIEPIINEVKKYKKVFVYIIGTQISTGEITPQAFFKKLKQSFEENDIQYTMMIDDVHGMFLMPRDYSLFDYVLYTAHAIVPQFEMGLLISKKGDIGIFDYNWGAEYLKRLDIVLSRKSIISQLKMVLKEYLYDFIIENNFQTYNNTVGHIFAIKTQGIYYTDEEIDKLKQYNIVVSEHKCYNSFIRIRFQEFMRQPFDKIEEGINYLREIINRKQLMCSMMEG